MDQPVQFPKDLLNDAELLFNQKVEIIKIEKSLDEAGYDAESIRLVLSFLKKQKHKREMNHGITLMIIGALILFGSCIVNVYLFHANITFHYFMYGSSAIGITVCFW